MEYETILRRMAVGRSEAQEQKLASRLAQRQLGALEQVIRQYTYVSAVAWRTLAGRASREDTEEIAADVFTALWNICDQLDPAQGLRPWLAAAARNKAIDRLRREKGLAPAPLEQADRLESPAEGPESRAVQREQARRLWRAVESLGEPESSLVFRYYYQEEKLKDIAAELGMNLSTAKSRLRRARQKLKEILTQGGDGE